MSHVSSIWGRSRRRQVTCASGLLVALALLAGCGSGAAQQPATNATDTPVATTGSTGGGPVLPPTATLAPVTGAADACGWFTLDAASQVLGSQAGAPSVQKTAGSTFCTYSAQANGETLLFAVQQGANAVNKYHSEQQTATGTSGYQVITGLGDGAFWTPTDGLVALNGQSFFTMQVLHVQSPSSLLPQEEQLIRVAFARLGSH